MGAFCLLHVFLLPAYLFFTAIPDGVYKPAPFPDMWSILQAGACWRRGVDVYVPNRCMAGGVFNYSPFFLRLGVLPLSGRQAEFFGLLQALAFIFSLRFLPLMAGRREILVVAAGVFSPTVYYAVEQGNFDVAIFVMALAGVLLLRRRAWAAYALFGLAAALKFYPAALFVTALRERLPRLAALALLGAVAVLGFGVVYGHDVMTALRIIPSGTPFRATFGRIDLARGLNFLHVLTARRADGLVGPVFFSGAAVAAAFSWGMSIAAIGASAALARRARAGLRVLPQDRLICLVAGAAVMMCCFYAAQNVYYRAIFLLLTLPGLYAMRKWGLVAAILALLWEAAPRALLSGHPVPRVAFWLCRECVWWWVAVELGALVLAFVMLEVSRLRREWQVKN